MLSPCGAVKGLWQCVARRRAEHRFGSSTSTAKEVAALGGSPVLELQTRGMRWLERPKWPSRYTAVGDG